MDDTTTAITDDPGFPAEPPPVEEYDGGYASNGGGQRSGGQNGGGDWKKGRKNGPPPRTYDRTPPHSMEAEVSVLGASLQSKNAAAEALEHLTPDDFYRAAHRTVFEAIADLNGRGEPVDEVTVLDWLRHQQRLDEIGGPTALLDLTSAVPTAANAAYYATIVKDKALLRRLIDAGTDVVRMAYESVDEAKVTVDVAESLIYQVAETGARSDVEPLRGLLNETFAMIEALSERSSEVTGLATGFDDLDRLTAGLQKQNLIIIAARPAMGKCLPSRSQVLDHATGARVRIGDLVADRTLQEDFRAASVGEDLRLVPTRPADFIDNGVKPVFKLTTRLGREVVATANHPLLTLAGWKPLEEFTPGDRLAVPRELGVFGDRRLGDEEVALLGYLIGDGGLTSQAPKFTTADQDILEDFTGWVEQLGGRVTSQRVGAAWQVRCNRGHVVTHDDIAVFANVSPSLVSRALAGVGAVGRPAAPEAAARIQATADRLGWVAAPTNPVRELCLRHGQWGLGSHDKFVPDAIFTAPKDQVALFLSRLFATDGTAWTSDRIQGIGYTSVSKRLAKDVQHLLLRFGINAKLRTRQVKYLDGHNTAYELDIRGAEDIRTFRDELTIFSKEEALERVWHAVEDRIPHTNVDTIPVEVWDWIVEDKGDRSWADISQATGRPRNHNWHVGKRGVSRRLLAELAQVLDSDRLRDLATSDLWWDEVVSIEPAGTDRVYDLEIPGLHNFVADDVVVHNSSLVMNIAHYVTARLREPVVVFNLEMSKHEIVQRLLSAEAGIPSSKLRTGQLDDHDWRRLSDALGTLAEAPLFIDDTPNTTVMEIRAKARRLKQRNGLSLIIIDYLQLMSSHSNKSDNRQQEVSEISRGLKMLAKELDVPVIALSQLSRQPETRTDKRPMLAYLRESGSIEQDADIVSFIYRDDVYNEDSEDRGIAELIISKHRNGATGTVRLAFLNHLTKFANLARGAM